MSGHLRTLTRRIIRFLVPPKDARLDRPLALPTPPPDAEDELERAVRHRITTDLAVLIFSFAILLLFAYLVVDLFAGPDQGDAKNLTETAKWIRAQRPAGAESWVFTLSATLLIPTLLFLMNSEGSSNHPSKEFMERTRFVRLARSLGLAIMTCGMASAWMVVPAEGESFSAITGVLGAVIAFLCTSAARVVLLELVANTRAARARAARTAEVAKRLHNLSHRRSPQRGDFTRFLAWIATPPCAALLCLVLFRSRTRGGDAIVESSAASVIVALVPTVVLVFAMFVSSLRRMDGGRVAAPLVWFMACTVLTACGYAIGVRVHWAFAVVWILAVTVGLLQAERRYGGLLDVLTLRFEDRANRLFNATGTESGSSP